MRTFTMSISRELLAALDRAARKRHESRSHLVTRILRETARARRDAEVTRRLDVLFADPEIVAEQLRTAVALDRAAADPAWDW